MASTIEIFCCYAHEDQTLLRKLNKHLMPLQRQGLITIWSDTHINAGLEWEKEIKAHLDAAHIILLLISADFMDSDYCYSKEMRRAIERHDRGEARVIPILLRRTYWKGTPFEKLQVLPTNARPVVDQSWYTEDDALYDVAEQINTVVKELRIQFTLSEARKLYSEQHYEEALVIYNQALQIEPHCAPAHRERGETLLALANDEDSLLALNTAIELDPQMADASFYQHKAQALDHLHRHDESLAAYQEAMQRNPFDVQLYTEKATLLLHLHRYSEALTVYEHVTRLEPNNAEHYIHQGDMLLKLQSPQKASAMYEQAVQLAPQQVQYYQKLGELFLGLKRYEEALNMYQQAIQLAGEQSPYYQGKGMALLSLNRYEEALTAYDESLQYGTNDNPSCYYGKGQALLALQRYNEALAAYEQAIHLSTPDVDPVFYHGKATVYEQLVQYYGQLAQDASKQEQQARLHSKQKEKNYYLILPLDTEAITLLHTITSHTDLVMSVAFSPDGQTLASGSYDKTIKVWNWQSGQELRTLTNHSSTVLSVAFSPDGQTLASGSSDTTIKLWNWQTGQELRTLTGHTGVVWSVAFSPDGQTLASGSGGSSSGDNTIKVWNWQSGQELRTLTGHTSQVRSVAFSPDAQTLASGSDDNTIKLWGAI